MRTRHRHPLVTRLVLAGIAVPVMAAAMLVVSPGSAAAASPPTSAGQQLFCHTGGTTSNNPASQNDLPMIRWSNAVASQHSDLSIGLFDLSQVPDVIVRDGVVSNLNGISQSEWTLSSDLVELSQRFCVADSIGYQTDNIVGKVWHAITSGAKGPVLLTALALIVIISTLWGLSRGKPKPWSRLLKFTVVLGVLVVMGTGAAASTNTGGNYQPGLLSPGWIISNTFGLVSNVGNSLAAGFSSINQQPLSVPSTVGQSDPMSCGHYTTQLVKEYQQSYTNTSLSYAVPEALNGLWMQSTIPTFVDEQFGANNNFGPLVYCHLLDDESNIPPKTQKDIALAGSPALAHTAPNTIPSALAWTATSNQEVDESVIGWAACQSPGADLVPSEWNLTTGAQVTPSEWSVVKNPDNGNGMTVQQQDCQRWWGSPATGSSCGWSAQCPIPVSAMNSTPLDPNKSPFYWPDDPSGIEAAANTAESQTLSDGSAPVGAGLNNFISNFHGTTSTSAVITSYIYLASSTGVALIFLVMALAILLAKLALLVSMLLMVFVVMAALMPGGSPDKITAFGKHLLGLILFVTCGSLLVSAITVLTSLIAAAGTGLVGNYNIMSIIWVGLSPLGAIVLIHHFFKKVLKAPSPFKPSSALAYSGAAGGFATGVGGMALLDAMKHHAGRGVRAVASRGVSRDGSGTGHGGPGGGPGSGASRMGRMSPTPGGTAATAGTAGAAATAGAAGAAGLLSRPETPAERAAKQKVDAAATPGARAKAEHQLVKEQRRAERTETKAAKQLRLESYRAEGSEHPRIAVARDRLVDASRSHYHHWRATGGAKRAVKRAGLVAASVALGAPGGVALAAYAYHRHRARRRAGIAANGAVRDPRMAERRRQAALNNQQGDQRTGQQQAGQQGNRQGSGQQGSGQQGGNRQAGQQGADAEAVDESRYNRHTGTPRTFRQVGRERRQQSLDTWRQQVRERAAAPAGDATRSDEAAASDDFGPVAQSSRRPNEPDGEQVGSRHVPNSPPESTPPELYDGLDG